MKTCICGIVGGLMLGFAAGIVYAPYAAPFDRKLVERCKALRAEREALDPEKRAWLDGQIETNDAVKVKWNIIYALARIELHD